MQWLRDGLGILTDVAESEAIATSVADSGGVWCVPAFQGLGTTYLEPAARARYLEVAGSVLLAVILVRILWVMTHNSIARGWIRLRGFHPRRPIGPPTVGSGIAISWSGMRGIVTLAAALALPEEGSGGAFPFRDLIVVTAFGCARDLVVQAHASARARCSTCATTIPSAGRPGGPAAARSRADYAGGDDLPAAQAVRHELTAHPAAGAANGSRGGSAARGPPPSRARRRAGWPRHEVAGRHRRRRLPPDRGRAGLVEMEAPAGRSLAGHAGLFRQTFYEGSPREQGRAGASLAEGCALDPGRDDPRSSMAFIDGRS
jgi:hypothetical protein